VFKHKKYKDLIKIKINLIKTIKNKIIILFIGIIFITAAYGICGINLKDDSKIVENQSESNEYNSLDFTIFVDPNHKLIAAYKYTFGWDRVVVVW